MLGRTLRVLTILTIAVSGCGDDDVTTIGGDAGAPDGGRDAGAGVACRVEGTTYPSGASNVPDPTSCNTCQCEQGALVGCTEIACPEPCPSGFERGTACVACGPLDECLEIETGCYRTCAAPDDCAAERPFCDLAQGLCIPFPCG